MITEVSASVFERIAATCASPPKASPALKAFVARARALKGSK